MKLYRSIFIFIFALTFAACFWSEEKPSANRAENPSVNQSAKVPANAETSRMPPENDVVTQPATDVIPKTETIKSLKTPTETYRTFIVATFNKDVETIRQTVSKGGNEYLETAAKKQNTTVAELLTGGAVEKVTREIPEIKNEKIDGNRATIEVKNELGLYNTIPLVKENGEWKISLDVLAKQGQEKFDEIKERLSKGK